MNLVSDMPVSDDVLSPDEELYQLPDVAKILAVPVTRIHQMLRDNALLALRRGGVIQVPERFFTVDPRTGDGRVVRWIPGLVSVLHDGGFTPEQALRWLFTEDDSLPGRPVDALHGPLAREVVRRAQALAM